MSKKLKIIQFICFVLAILLIFPYGSICVNAEREIVSGERVVTEQSQKSLIIERLNAERTQAMLLGDSKRVKEITNELRNYGVVQMTYSEMCGLFNEPVPLYESQTDNYLYERYSDDFKWEGKVYTVMVIFITPTSSECNLCVRGSFSERRVNKMGAGALVALDIASVVLGNVKKLEKIATLYDILKILQNIPSYFEDTTVVNNVEAAYLWSLAETCSFHYIPSTIGTSGWTLIGRFNRINGVISTNILGMDYDSASGDAVGTIDTYNYSVNIQAEGFYNDMDTVLDYYNGLGTKDNMTRYLEIKGVDGSAVHKVNFLNPPFPMGVH